MTSDGPASLGLPTVASAASALQAHFASRLHLGPKPSGPPNAPSLAERLGLVPATQRPPPLSPDQWLAVRLQSLARGDSTGDCAICLRSFRAEGQASPLDACACFSGMQR